MKFTHEMNDLQKADFLATIASEIPDTERLFARVLSDMPRGLEFLVGLRADLLQMMRQQSRDNDAPDQQLELLRTLDMRLRKSMAEWFSDAALGLDTITMGSPPYVLEKVVSGEKVHPIESREALAQRLGGGRRCFALFHRRIFPCFEIVLK